MVKSTVEERSLMHLVHHLQQIETELFALEAEEEFLKCKLEQRQG